MNVGKIFKPNSEFKNRSKAAFLAAYNSKFPPRHPKISIFHYLIRGAAFGLSMVVILTAGATYANQQNVAVDSLLYPLKRSAELAKILFTDKEKEPEVHLEFAERRLAEIKAIREKNPSSPHLPILVKNLEKEVLSSIQTIEAVESRDFRSNSLLAKPPSAKIAPPESSALSQTSPLPTTGDVSSATSTPTNSPAPLNGEVERDEKKFEKPKNLLDNKTRSLGSRRLDVCEAWRNIVSEKDDEVVGVLRRIPDLLEKVSAKCESIIENHATNSEFDHSIDSDQRN